MNTELKAKESRAQSYLYEQINLANQLAERGCKSGAILAKLNQAVLDGNLEQVALFSDALRRQLDCSYSTMQGIFSHDKPKQNYSYFLSEDCLANIKKLSRKLKNFEQHGVNTEAENQFCQSMFMLVSKHQEAKERLQQQFGHANPPSESNAGKQKSDSNSDSNSQAEGSENPKSNYKRDVSLSGNKNNIAKFANVFPGSKDINKARTEAAQRLQSVQAANKGVSVTSPSESSSSTSYLNQREEFYTVAIDATEPPTNLGPKDKTCFFSLMCYSSFIGLPSLNLEENTNSRQYFLCKFYLLKKEGQEKWELTKVTQEFRDKGLLPIDFGSQTPASLALFIANLLMIGNMSVRQVVSMLDCLGISLSKTSIQNIKKIADDNVFAPSAAAIEQIARELADVIYLDETNYKYLEPMASGRKRRKNHAFIQQMCSGPNSNVQFVLFRLMENRKTQTMEQVIDLASFENLWAFESDGLPQYITLKAAYTLIYQRCLAHAYRYSKAPFIDLIKSVEQAHFDLDAKKITQEEFDNFISSKQRGLDDYDRNLFEIMYGLQTIFFIEDKAREEASILVAKQKAEGEDAKQIYLQTILEYRQTYTSKIQQSIELSFNRLQAIVEKDSMLSATRLKAFTYLKNAFNDLFSFIDNPELEAHNNYCEANFKSILRIRRNNNDMANSREEAVRITHYRTLERTLYLNGVTSLKDQIRFQLSMQEAQFVNAANQAAALIFATYNPARDPKTGFFDITPFITQFKVSYFANTFDSTKFVFNFLSSKGTSFPSDLSDNINRLFRREALTIQVNRSQLLETYLKRFKFKDDSCLDEIKLRYPNLFNCDAALSELKQMDAERVARQQARLKNSGLNGKSGKATSDCKTKHTKPPSNKAKRGRVSANRVSTSNHDSPQGNKCSYISTVAS